MLSLREHIERRIVGTGNLTTVDRALYRLLATALNASPPLIERRTLWISKKVRRPCAVKSEAALERLWRAKPGWVGETLESYLAAVAKIAKQPL